MRMYPPIVMHQAATLDRGKNTRTGVDTLAGTGDARRAVHAVHVGSRPPLGTSSRRYPPP